MGFLCLMPPDDLELPAPAAKPSWARGCQRSHGGRRIHPRELHPPFPSALVSSTNRFVAMPLLFSITQAKTLHVNKQEKRLLPHLHISAEQRSELHTE